jgi:hypothetical protein
VRNSGVVFCNPCRFLKPYLSVLSIVLTIALLAGCGGGGGGSVGGEINPPTSNTPPTADAGADLSVTEGNSVQLNGSGTDVEGAVTFSWQQTSGPSGTFSSTSAATPSFTAPQVAGNQMVILVLTVTDSDGLSSADSLNITVLDADGGSGSVSSTYLYYEMPLSGVDPANPTTPTLIEPTANLVESPMMYSAQEFVVADYDGTTKVASNIRSYAVVYAKTDGHLYKVYSSTSRSLAPVQVSSESHADHFCGLMYGTSAVPDYSNPEASQFVYTTGGADNTCDTADDVWKMVKLDMDESTPPINAHDPVMMLSDPSSGALTGWLVNIGNTLSRCDENFANCFVITTYTNYATGPADALNYVMLVIDSVLYSYDVASNTLSSPIYTLAGFLVPIYHDETYGYFHEGKTVYRFPLDGSTTATALTVETKDIVTFDLTASSIIVGVGASGSADEIKSIPKAGGVPVTIMTIPPTDDVYIMGLSDGFLYYNVRDYVMNSNGILYLKPIVAGVVAVDLTSQVEYADAAWVGYTDTTTFDYKKGNARTLFVDKMILAQDFDQSASDTGGYAGSSLSVYDAASGTYEMALGTLPTTDGIFNISCYGYTGPTLCETIIGLVPAPSLPAFPFQQDIFYIDATVANSIARVTNTTNERESLFRN